MRAVLPRWPSSCPPCPALVRSQRDSPLSNALGAAGAAGSTQSGWGGWPILLCYPLLLLCYNITLLLRLGGTLKFESGVGANSGVMP